MFRIESPLTARKDWSSCTHNYRYQSNSGTTIDPLWHIVLCVSQKHKRLPDGSLWYEHAHIWIILRKKNTTINAFPFYEWKLAFLVPKWLWTVWRSCICLWWLLQHSFKKPCHKSPYVIQFPLRQCSLMLGLYYIYMNDPLNICGTKLK